MTVLSDVDTALPDEWTWVWRIHELVGKGTTIYNIRRALSDLYVAGKAERAPAFKDSRACYVYRRARLPEQRTE